ncbi:hypothetical protein ABPG73_004962 [Tetrahymena malaccensis]
MEIISLLILVVHKLKQQGKRLNPYKIHTPYYPPLEQKQKDAFLKIELLTKKKNPDYIKQALDIIQGLSNKNLKKLLKSLEAQEIFKNQTYRSLDFFLLEKSLNGLSDQDFFEFYIKIYEKKENQDKKQEVSIEIAQIEELKNLRENHKYITINLSENANKNQIYNTDAIYIGSAPINLQLSKLSLGLEQNQIKQSEFIEQALSNIEHFIKLKLYLKNNKMNDVGSMQIGQALQNCKNLMHLLLDLEYSFTHL